MDRGPFYMQKTFARFADPKRGLAGRAEKLPFQG